MAITRYRNPALRFRPLAEFDDLEKRFRQLASQVIEPVREGVAFVPPFEVIEKPDAGS